MPHTAFPLLHPSSVTWLKGMTAQLLPGNACTFDIYTDGSFCADDGRAGWAVLVVVRDDTSEQLVGAFSDCLDSFAPELPDGDVDAHVAEMVAMFHALAIAAAADSTTFHVKGDCASVLAVAGAEATSGACPRLATAILDLRLIARQRGNVITFGHVHSHTGNAGNEAVDSLAKAAAGRVFRIPAEVRQLTGLASSAKLGWLWWTVTDHCSRGAMPGLHDTGETLPDSYPPLPCRHACHFVPGIPANRCNHQRGHSVDANLVDEMSLIMLFSDKRSS